MTLDSWLLDIAKILYLPETDMSSTRSFSGHKNKTLKSKPMKRGQLPLLSTMLKELSFRGWWWWLEGGGVFIWQYEFHYSTDKVRSFRLPLVAPYSSEPVYLSKLLYRKESCCCGLTSLATLDRDSLVMKARLYCLTQSQVKFCSLRQSASIPDGTNFLAYDVSQLMRWIGTRKRILVKCPTQPY